jgi:hypothetical protein
VFTSFFGSTPASELLLSASRTQTVVMTVTAR